MARITLKVHPRARRTGFAGRFGDAWKLDLAAPPVAGKANEECLRFLADFAGIPRSRVRLLSGAAARLKVIEVADYPQADLDHLLAERAAGSS